MNKKSKNLNKNTYCQKYSKKGKCWREGNKK